MVELATIIAAGSIAATFFSDVLSRIVKTVVHARRRETHNADVQPAH